MIWGFRFLFEKFWVFVDFYIYFHQAFLLNQGQSFNSLHYLQDSILKGMSTSTLYYE